MKYFQRSSCLAHFQTEDSLKLIQVITFYFKLKILVEILKDLS